MVNIMSNLSHGIGADPKLQRIIDQDLGLVPPDSNTTNASADDLESIEADAEEKSWSLSFTKMRRWLNRKGLSYRYF